MRTLTRRTLTELDHARLSSLISRHGRNDPTTETISTLLDEADLVPPPQIHSDIVTMHSTVRLSGAGIDGSVTICYPLDSDPAAGRISVLSPMGAALLGSRIGDEVQWRTPTGVESRARVEAVTFQPEASGDYTR